MLVRGPYKKRKNKDFDSFSPPKSIQSSSNFFENSSKENLELSSDATLYSSSTRNGNLVIMKQRDSCDVSSQLRSARNRFNATILEQFPSSELPSSAVVGMLLSTSENSDVGYIKAEPTDDIERLANPDHPYAAGFSHPRSDFLMDMTGNYDLPGLSRTSGRKYGWSDCSAAGVETDDVDSTLLNVVVRLRANRAPPIPSRLIIPIIRVPRSTLFERGVTLSTLSQDDETDVSTQCTLYYYLKLLKYLESVN